MVLITDKSELSQLFKFNIVKYFPIYTTRVDFEPLKVSNADISYGHVVHLLGKNA